MISKALQATPGGCEMKNYHLALNQQESEALHGMNPQLRF